MLAETLKPLFLIRDDITFLNHGSFGACPRPVFEAYQQWQLRVERQPVEFLGREVHGYLAEMRSSLASFLHCDVEGVIPVRNATFGVNLVAQSLRLSPGDEILSNDHEYGACRRAWEKVCRQSGANYIEASIPLPVGSSEEIAERIWSRVTARTKVLFLSHITSPTALLFPVEELCRRARERGILSFVDGAHAPGQIPLTLSTLGADFYTGNCHKWLCAPKGAAFLYTAQAARKLVHPLVVSWGGDRHGAYGDPYLDELEWLGTDDPSAYLTIPDAIRFQEEHQWEEVRSRCYDLIHHAKESLESRRYCAAVSPSSSRLTRQMAAVMLTGWEAEKLKAQLYDRFHIEVPVWEWGGRTLLRVSMQGYNTKDDLERLLTALDQLS